jgi:hypothetical protein
MMNTQSETALARVPSSNARTKAWESIFAHRFTVYICVLLFAAIGAYGYWLRTHTIFACKADGYSADRYLAYCNGTNYADYEHGAFQFDLEPSVLSSVRDANVLFLGNSRLQIALSTFSTEEWFSSNSARYYLLGFLYYENALFEGELLRRIHPQADVYVINIDDFFEESETVPMRMILHDPRAREAYEAKRFWQRVHKGVCGALEALCGSQFVVFRSRDTGRYYTEGAVNPKEVPVSYDPVVNQAIAKTSIETAVDFLSRFAKKKCVILTMAPYAGTEIGTAEAIARGVGLKLVMPEVGGLQTFDGYHLDQPSAQRWSQAFFRLAGPEIRSCLDNRSAANSQGPSLPGRRHL